MAGLKIYFRIEKVSDQSGANYTTVVNRGSTAEDSEVVSSVMAHLPLLALKNSGGEDMKAFVTDVQDA